MFENIGSFFKKIMKNETKELVSDTTATNNASKEAAKERLQLVLMQDRANVSADFLELMKQEIVDVIKKYIVVEEDTIDVRIINQENEDGTQGAPSLCANIPILNIRNDNKGEKFRKEQSANITKDVTSEAVEQKASDNNSNDNVKIVNDIEDTIEELNNEEISNVVEENIENMLNSDVNDRVEENLETVNKDLNEENSEIIDEDAELERLEKIANEVLMNTSSNIELDNLDNYEENEDEEDDDDDDVTFDDLLKAAEEEEKMQKQVKTTKKSTSSKVKSSKSKSTSKSNKPKKKTNKK